MLLGKRVVAVVPARSGSKGLPDKNIRKLAGVSLVGHAGICLSKLPWLDAKVISTDSVSYAEEAKRYGLDAPFLRPANLASDGASAVDTMIHAILACEQHYGSHFDIALIVEPTSPLRRPEDIDGVTRLLIESAMDSVVCVSPVSSQFHPRKILNVVDGALGYYEAAGKSIVARQQLSRLYVRNGIGYGVTRDCLVNQQLLISERTLPYIVEREYANIDDALDFKWAEFLMGLQQE